MGTNDEIDSFYKRALTDEKFAKIIKNLFGLRGPRTPTVFEALIIALTEQQIALPARVLLGFGVRVLRPR